LNAPALDDRPSSHTVIVADRGVSSSGIEATVPEAVAGPIDRD
jgi:hypothetical protein